MTTFSTFPNPRPYQPFSGNRMHAFIIGCLLLLLGGTLHAQGSFMRLLPPGTDLSDEESKLRSNFLQSDDVVFSSIVSVSSIKDYLTADNKLSISLPDLSQPLIFRLDHATIKSDNDYYWSGIGVNAATIRVFKSPAGNLISIFNPENHASYVIKDLSETRQILIKHAIPLEDVGDCGEDYDEGYSALDKEVIERSGCETNKVRVLYVFTKDALAASSAGALATLAATVTAEINNACVASGITPEELSFENAGCLPVNQNDCNCAQQMLNWMKSSTEIKDLQVANYADIVVLFADNLKRGWFFCGAAGDAVNDAAGWDKAYCCSMIEQAETYFKATHGIGHIMGAGHQRCTDGCLTQCSGIPGQSGGVFSYNHGVQFKNPNSGQYMAKTIMSDCHGYDLARLGRWSAENITVNFDIGSGLVPFPTGNENCNNARRLKVRTGRVACFRPDPPNVPPAPPTVVISGLYFVNRCSTYTYTSSLYSGSNNGFGSPVTFTWEMSLGGFTYYPLNEHQDHFTFSPASYPDHFFIRLKVNGPLSGDVYSNAIEITNSNCTPFMGADNRDDIPAAPITDGDITLFPNPMGEQLNLSAGNGTYTVKIYHPGGQLLTESQLQIEAGQPGVIHTQQLKSGVYFISVDSQDKHFVSRIVKL